MSIALREYTPTPEVPDDFWSRLGIPNSEPELYASIQEGLPYSVYSELASMLGLERKELAKYAMIPQTTLQRRMKSGRFNTEESDRLYRIAKVVQAAYGLFENLENARHWLAQPARALGGKIPLEMLGTSVGSNAILTLIGRLEYGVYT